MVNLKHILLSGSLLFSAATYAQNQQSTSVQESVDADQVDYVDEHKPVLNLVGELNSDNQYSLGLQTGVSSPDFEWLVSIAPYAHLNGGKTDFGSLWSANALWKKEFQPGEGKLVYGARFQGSFAATQYDPNNQSSIRLGPVIGSEGPLGNKFLISPYVSIPFGVGVSIGAQIKLSDFKKD